ncbi:GYDIA family GHMP kinase [Marixanthomonas spongiae]|uniref:GHMP kinase n=1 Tax=Marixanthomonas spongiae TaxID=2174845 RepID=A0A2U0I894_9FLAO|nr:GYDIA family GHMP kinase [Marixanthomonas spongiae]PVW17316.1 GHMP kinase [Marixanthomonas spongiae]
MNNTFYSHGKLLLTGEYVVLDGAKALAIPTKYGQRLTILPTTKGDLLWNSFDVHEHCWFGAGFYRDNFEIEGNNNPRVAHTLQQILCEAKRLNPNFFTQTDGIHAITELEFPQDWGLGSSSTLINNIAQWANVDAYALLKNSFGGSGYDIAAAQQDGPFLYQLKDGQPKVQQAHLQWDFKDALFFVHLNKKQDSKDGIAHYRTASVSEKDIQEISDISNELVFCPSLSDFEAILQRHEQLISDLINFPTVKEKRFKDFKGVVKSLGAWGGDFVLATGDKTNQDYFRRKGYSTIIPFNDMIL